MSVDPAWIKAQGDDAVLLFSALRASGFVTPPVRIGVAVSGGGDSMAMLHVFSRIVSQTGQDLFAVTVNHGLRTAAVEEARHVADFCALHGIAHEVIHWKRTESTGNLQDQARRARYDLIAQWARRHKIRHVMVGHTADDQAETFLMRLARASGVDGLSGMRRRWTEGQVQFQRPFLEHDRAELRAYLMRNAVDWIDDPSNEDLRFDRVKARKALAHLKPLGITTDTITQVTRNISMAQSVVETQTLEIGGQMAVQSLGDIVIDRTALMHTHPEIARRLLIKCLIWVASAAYAPRSRALVELDTAIRQIDSKTLHGCRVSVDGQTVRISRELRAVRGVVSPVSKTWDGRWRLKGPSAKGFEVRALGPHGLRQCPDWREVGMPRTSLVSTPAIWRDDELIAAPVAGLSNGWTAQIVADFHDVAFAH